MCMFLSLHKNRDQNGMVCVFYRGQVAGYCSLYRGQHASKWRASPTDKYMVPIVPTCITYHAMYSQFETTVVHSWDYLLKTLFIS